MFNYYWQLKNGYPAPSIEKHGKKVFSTFACGGGSTMGYKLAGYEVIGANDIDPEMARVYQGNHHPAHYFLNPIGDLLTMDLPDALYNLDILDGSPPCSTFSMAGSREKGWKKNKKFREGQSEQVLSDLFFDWIKLVDRLKPKVAVAENVKGMLNGNAKAYTEKIVLELNSIGYDVQLFMLNASTMGVPQARERVFFICRKRSLNLPPIKFNFNEKKIFFRDIERVCDTHGKDLSEAYKKWWGATPRGKSFATAHPKGSYFNTTKVHPDKVLPTIIASSGAKLVHYEKPVELSDQALCIAGTFPIDYDFMGVEPKYLIGMSVPPIMLAQIALEIYSQILYNSR